MVAAGFYCTLKSGVVSQAGERDSVRMYFGRTGIDDHEGSGFLETLEMTEGEKPFIVRDVMTLDRPSRQAIPKMGLPIWPRMIAL